MSKIIDSSKWKDQEVDGFVMANFLLDPKAIQEELNVTNLHHIDDILTYIKTNKDKMMTLKSNLNEIHQQS